MFGGWILYKEGSWTGMHLDRRRASEEGDMRLSAPCDGFDTRQRKVQHVDQVAK